MTKNKNLGPLPEFTDGLAGIKPVWQATALWGCKASHEDSDSKENTPAGMVASPTHFVDFNGPLTPVSSQRQLGI
jgi:hypothetical protein